MIHLNILLNVTQPDDIGKVRELLAEQGRLSRGTGLAAFRVTQSINDPGQFFLYEEWTDQASLDVHRTATAYTTIYAPQVLPLVTRVPHPSRLVE
ncbi:MAG: antibiotic biosynthesis monooxygenase [Pirellulales bacterium]